MARAIDPRSTFEYVLKADRELPADSPDRTVWILRRLTAADEAWLQDQIRADAGTMELRITSGTIALETLRRGLVGASNFRDPAGDEVPAVTEKGRVADRYLDRIDAADRNELCDAISGASRMDAATAGKS